MSDGDIYDHDQVDEIVWQGRFITARKKGRWEYVSRARGIRAAVILAVDRDDHVILVEQYRVPLGNRCIELPAGLIGDDAGDELPHVERYWRLPLVFVGLIVLWVVASTQLSELRSRFYCYIAACAAAICSLTCLTSWWNCTFSGNRADDAETLRLRTELEHLQRPVAAQGSPTSPEPTAYLAMGSAPPWVPPGLPTPSSFQTHHGPDGLADPAGTPLGAFLNSHKE